MGLFLFLTRAALTRRSRERRQQPSSGSVRSEDDYGKEISVPKVARQMLKTTAIHVKSSVSKTRQDETMPDNYGLEDEFGKVYANSALLDAHEKEKMGARGESGAHAAVEREVDGETASAPPRGHQDDDDALDYGRYGRHEPVT